MNEKYSVIAECLCGCDDVMIEWTSAQTPEGAAYKIMRERKLDNEPIRVLFVINGWHSNELLLPITEIRGA